MILFKDGRTEAEGRELHYSLAVKEGQHVCLALAAFGGGSAELDIDIVGKDADVDLKGLFICSGDDRTDIKVNLVHSSGGSVSNQLFKGLAGGNAKVRFDGRITVVKDAGGTEANQTCRGILMSETASVEASPQLVIYADDVKCSHGAAMGSLDADELFYMRSRGISLREARRLQIHSFLAPVMEALPERMQADAMSIIGASDLF